MQIHQVGDSVQAIDQLDDWCQGRVVMMKSWTDNFDRIRGETFGGDHREAVYGSAVT